MLYFTITLCSHRCVLSTYVRTEYCLASMGDLFDFYLNMAAKFVLRVGRIRCSNFDVEIKLGLLMYFCKLTIFFLSPEMISGVRHVL